MTRSRNILAPRFPWGPEEDAIIRALYPVNAAEDIAPLIDRTVSGVHQRARTLGVAKSPEWVAERTRQRWAEGRHEGSRRSHFRKGQAAPNKGRPQGEWMPPESRRRCARTQFRKGHLGGAAAEKMQPIGALRIADGQLQKTVNNDRPFMRRWVAVSRLVWEAANGTIPPGHAVAFKPGRHTVVEAEITPDRLELLSRAELMRRNSYHTRYPELAPLIQLKGALNRKIKNRSKAA